MQNPETEKHLNRSALDSYDSSSHERRSFVDRWVSSQTVIEDASCEAGSEASENKQCQHIPTILVTETPQQEDTLLPSALKAIQSPTDRTSRYPVQKLRVADEGGEDEDMTKAEADKSIYPTNQSAGSSSELSAEPEGRRRAMSYPADKQQATPFLSLSPVKQKQMNPEQSQQESQEAGAGGFRKYVELTLMAKQWKRKGLSTKVTKEGSEEALLNHQRRRACIEVPQALRQEILEEALPVVVKASQMYSSHLGPKHTLTQQSKEHIDKLMEKLGKL